MWVSADYGSVARGNGRMEDFGSGSGPVDITSEYGRRRTTSAMVERGREYLRWFFCILLWFRPLWTFAFQAHMTYDCDFGERCASVMHCKL